MIPQIEYGTVSHPDDAQRLGIILNQCFIGSPKDWLFYSHIVGLENFRFIRRAGEIVGGLAILQMGQWFGGQCLPMAGIASVGVSPEYRGTGVAAELLTQMLKELYAKEVPISTLYAATQRLYRKVGYEQAGTYCRWELPLNSIELSVSHASLQEIRNLPVRSVPSQVEVFQTLYRQKAMQNNGNLERNQTIWKRVCQPPDEVVYAYLIGSESQPDGYIIFNQCREADESKLYIRDWVALTATAGRRLWTFLGNHRSMVEKVVSQGSSLDPLLLLLSEQSDRISNLERWMLRVIDVPRALEKRGYPLGMEGELHLNVRDDLLPENNGKFVLTVSRGRGEVTRGGRGDLSLNVRGLAPLYTGLFTPYQLQLTGQLEANDEALSLASGLFVGQQPWMSDFF